MKPSRLIFYLGKNRGIDNIPIFFFVSQPRGVGVDKIQIMAKASTGTQI